MSAATAEYLDQHLRDYPLFCEVDPRTARFRPARVFEYLDGLFGQPGTAGFKLMYSNLLRLPEIWLYLIRRKVRLIHLIRENHLDVLISSEIRHARRVVHSIELDCCPLQDQVRLDPGRIIQELKRIERNQRIARTLVSLTPLPKLEVRYEGLVAELTEFANLCAFLNLPSNSPMPRSALRRLVTQSHREILANYQEVRAVLGATRFSALLH